MSTSKARVPSGHGASSGPSRPSAGQLKTKSVQLAVYRLAWARLKDVPVDDVRAAFYYVADNQVVRPHDLASGDELESIVASALADPAG